MKTTIKREDILAPLQQVIGAVERRQTLPILGNVLLKSIGGDLSLTATDLEIEMVARISADSSDDFQTTIPARKLLDICKALPESAVIKFNIEDSRVSLTSARSRFSLAALPAKDFPGLEEIEAQQTFSIPQNVFKSLFDKTSFAMAQQDVRYYLNGILMEISSDNIKLVATDGHRLALSETSLDTGVADEKQIIIPRKAVLELSRLLDSDDSQVKCVLSQNHLRVETDALVFTTKLIDGKFPDYQRVIPVDGNKTMEVDRETLKNSMSRIAILSNEKYRGIRLTLTAGNLSIQANNPDQEEAEEELQIDYNESDVEIGFNVTYLIDVLNVIDSEKVQVKLKDSNSSAIISDSEDDSSLYVVMPMRL
ncbi:MAG: DNA polymerase III subunit beta [Gammaproteobacteria bacterium]|nr:DNA polymerase III subunit beta [Gammaproteobacteria bacterium]MDH3857758.1 DNA polymerase III subunit beta [Gammaproteobacteria bacterium]